MTLAPKIRTLLAAEAAATVTVLVLASPSLHFAYRNPSAHATLETAAAMIALLAAYLVLGRYRSSHRLSDLVLVCGLGLLAVANFVFTALPWWLLNVSSVRFSGWASLLVSLLGSTTLVWAAFADDAPVRNPRRALAVAAALTAVAVLAILAWLALARSGLPLGIDPLRSPHVINQRWVPAAFTLRVAELSCAALLSLAAFGFTRRATEHGDRLLGWIACGAVLLAGARVNYFFFPSLAPDWAYVGDVLRMTGYVLILVGVVAEVSAYQRHAVELAVLDERRRIARDLHDGLAQELAFIAAQTRAFPGEDRRLRQLAAAAERALDEARAEISTLRQSLDEPFVSTLHRVIDEVAERTGTYAICDIQPGLLVDEVTKEALLRIVREAVANAGRHGKAERVRVTLANGDGLHLRITDDGAGFDAASLQDAAGFGLQTMRERAEALGGELHLTSSPAGTEVEVVLP